MSETTLERVLRLSGAGQVANPLDVVEVARALAASQAREKALREAVRDRLRAIDGEYGSEESDAETSRALHAALAQPADDSALRALMLEVRKRALLGGSFAVEHIDAVLRGGGR